MKQAKYTIGQSDCNVPNFHIIKVKHKPATNHRPAMVWISSELFENTISISYANEPGSLSPAMDTAMLFLRKKGFEIIGQGEGLGHYYIITSTFESIK